jgi:DNA-directed RNA polymerase specialized sigma24 family protein
VAWVVRTALNVNISRWRRRREVSVPDLGAGADLPATDRAAAFMPAYEAAKSRVRTQSAPVDTMVSEPA